MGKKATESRQVQRTKRGPFTGTSVDENAAGAICERLAKGESLRTICSSDDMPSMSTVMRWLDHDELFRNQYARARDDGMDFIAEEAMRIADEPVGMTDNGGTDNGAVAKQRLQIDTRKWFLSKLAPKKYGDNKQVEVTGKLSLEHLVAGDDE
jgi:hypothetical protein